MTIILPGAGEHDLYALVNEQLARQRAAEDQRVTNLMLYGTETPTEQDRERHRTAYAEWIEAERDLRQREREAEEALIASVPEHDATHLYLLLHGNQGLDLCGCGNPELAWELVRDILDCCPFYDNRDRVEALIGNAGIEQLILNMLNSADLIEHGGGIGGSWITDKGRWLLAMLQRYTSEQIEAALDGPHGGFPHADQFRNDGRRELPDCTSACWELPA